MKFWKYFLTGIVGAFLGFALQYIIDNGGESWVIVNAEYASPLGQNSFEERKPYHWIYRLEGRSLVTPYRASDGNFDYPGLPKDTEISSYPSIKKQAEWKSLWYQLRLLNWLQTNGDTIFRTTWLGALAMLWWYYLMFDLKRGKSSNSQ